MTFGSLQTKLIAHIRKRVQSGEMTERSLARLTGVSQPHIHNVLKGAKVLSLKTADQIVQRLHLDIADLWSPDEDAEAEGLSGIHRLTYLKVPVLEARLGPGFSFPDCIEGWDWYPFPMATVSDLENPVAAWAGPDADAPAGIEPGDLLLLDQSEHKRSAPQDRAYYVLDSPDARGVRRIRVDGETLYFLDRRPGAQDYISLTGRNILDVIRAKVVWLGRRMEQPSSATEPTEETGPGNRCPRQEGQ